jgi:hypothetical protein
MIPIATGTVREAKREVADVNMSRYACYLAVQSADSTKVIVGKAKTYCFSPKGEPTREVWDYQMQLPAGLRAYTKNKTDY